MATLVKIPQLPLKPALHKNPNQKPHFGAIRSREKWAWYFSQVEDILSPSPLPKYWEGNYSSEEGPAVVNTKTQQDWQRTKKQGLHTTSCLWFRLARKGSYIFDCFKEFSIGAARSSIWKKSYYCMLVSYQLCIGVIFVLDTVVVLAVSVHQRNKQVHVWTEETVIPC